MNICHAISVCLSSQSTVNTKSTGRSNTGEFKLSAVAVPKMANFYPAASSLANFNDTLNINDLYDLTLPSCTLATKESRFLGCGQFCLIN